jgi:hypothetical protein
MVAALPFFFDLTLIDRLWFFSGGLGIAERNNSQDCAGFWFVYKAHPPVHIGICAGGCKAPDR